MCIFSHRVDVRVAATAKIRSLLALPRSITDIFHLKAPYRLGKCQRLECHENVQGPTVLESVSDLRKLESVAFGAYDPSIRAIAIRQIRIGLRGEAQLLTADEVWLKAVASGCLDVLSSTDISNSLDSIRLELALEAAMLLENIVVYDSRTRVCLGFGESLLDLTPLFLIILSRSFDESIPKMNWCITQDLLLTSIFRIINLWSISDDIWSSAILESGNHMPLKTPKFEHINEVFPKFLEEHFGIVLLSPGHLAQADEMYRHYTKHISFVSHKQSSYPSNSSDLRKFAELVFDHYIQCRSSVLYMQYVLH